MAQKDQRKFAVVSYKYYTNTSNPYYVITVGRETDKRVYKLATKPAHRWEDDFWSKDKEVVGVFASENEAKAAVDELITARESLKDEIADAEEALNVARDAYYALKRRQNEIIQGVRAKYKGTI